MRWFGEWTHTQHTEHKCEDEEYGPDRGYEVTFKEWYYLLWWRYKGMKVQIEIQ